MRSRSIFFFFFFYKKKKNCIISDGFGHDRESRRLLTRIAQHNDLLFAFIYDPLEANLPEAGQLVFGDGMRQLEVDT